MKKWDPVNHKSSGRCSWVWCSALWDVLQGLGWWAVAQLYSWCICRELQSCGQPVIKQHIFHGDHLPLNTSLNIFFGYLVSHFVVDCFLLALCWHGRFYTVTFKGAFCKSLWKNCSAKMLSPNSFLARLLSHLDERGKEALKNKLNFHLL